MQWCFHSRVALNFQELDNFQLTEVGALHNDVFHQIISGDNMGTISVESSALWIMCTPKEASQVAGAIRCGISRPASWNSNFDVLIRQVQWLLTLSGKAFEVLRKLWIFDDFCLVSAKFGLQGSQNDLHGLWPVEAMSLHWGGGSNDRTRLQLGKTWENHVTASLKYS